MNFELSPLDTHFFIVTSHEYALMAKFGGLIPQTVGNTCSGGSSP